MQQLQCCAQRCALGAMRARDCGRRPASTMLSHPAMQLMPARNPPCDVVVRDGPVHGGEHHLPALWQVQAVSDPAGAVVDGLNIIQVTCLPQPERAVPCAGDVLVYCSTEVDLVNLLTDRRDIPAATLQVQRYSCELGCYQYWLAASGTTCYMCSAPSAPVVHSFCC